MDSKIREDDTARQRLADQRAEDEQRARERREERTAAASSPGVIYYLLVGDRIKIGHTANLNKRMPGYPPGTQLLAVHRGTPADEQALHRQFRALCTSGREWYSQAPELLAHIAAMQERYGTPKADLYERKDPHRRKPAPRLRSAH